MNLIGVDGGASSTRCLISNHQGEILAFAVGEPSSHPYTEESRKQLQQGLRSAIIAAMEQLPEEEATRCDAICLGFAGILLGSTGERQHHLIRSFLDPLVSYRDISIRNDMEIALKGASVSGQGVVVYAGTGSHAYGTDNQGRWANAGGWGYLFGDDGAGFHIGRSVLRAVFRAYDDPQFSTTLTERLLERFNTQDLQEIHAHLFRADKSVVPLVASLSRLASEAAAEGDIVAIKILEQAGRDLAMMSIRVIRKLGVESKPVEVYPAGGVFSANRRLKEQFEETLTRQVPYAHILGARFPPVFGALLFSMEQAAVVIRPEILARFASAPRDRRIG